jgi:hypothetical protein
VQAEGDLSATSAQKAADEKFLANLTEECSSKAQEWDERKKSATDELAALNKGKEWDLSARSSLPLMSSRL